MAFDMGFNFRNTAGFVTDNPHYGVPGLDEAYPHTYTNGDGQSINAGWTTAIDAAVDRDNTVDVRLAGGNRLGFGVVKTFQVDLASGSAPGAGAYTVDWAFGDAGTGNLKYTDMQLFDNNTSVLGNFTGTTSAAGHWFDATGVERTPLLLSWDLVRATSSVVFATTTVKLHCGDSSSTSVPYISHFRLTLQAAANVASRMFMLLGVGS